MTDVLVQNEFIVRLLKVWNIPIFRSSFLYSVVHSLTSKTWYRRPENWLFNPLFTASTKNICLWLHSRTDGQSAFPWSQGRAGQVVTDLGEASIRWLCPLWHRRELVCRAMHFLHTFSEKWSHWNKSVSHFSHFWRGSLERLKAVIVRKHS